jgi:hypothetical protein
VFQIRCVFAKCGAFFLHDGPVSETVPLSVLFQERNLPHLLPGRGCTMPKAIGSISTKPPLITGNKIHNLCDYRGITYSHRCDVGTERSTLRSTQEVFLSRISFFVTHGSSYATPEEHRDQGADKHSGAWEEEGRRMTQCCLVT